MTETDSSLEALRQELRRGVVVLAVLATVGLWSGSGPISAAAPALALVAATAILLMIAAPIAAAIGRRRVEPTASLVGARRMARRPTRFSAALAITEALMSGQPVLVDPAPAGKAN